MTTLLKASLIYPVTGEPVADGGIVVSGSVIEEFGNADRYDAGIFDSVIDLTGYLLMPGFVNSHSHLQWCAAKGKTEQGAPFSDWIQSIMRARQEITQTEQLSAMRQGIDEMLRSGITTVADVISDADSAQPIVDSQIKSVIFIEPIAPHEKEAEKTNLFVRSQIERLRQSGATPGVAPHSPYTVSPKLLKLLKSLSEEMDIPFSIHLAETYEEDIYIRKGSGDLAELLKLSGFFPEGFKGHGKSPVALLESLDLLRGCLAVHLNAVDKDDAALLASKNAVPIFCPQSSKWFGRDKVLPLESFMNAGLKPLLGTDSLASNESLSMLDELNCAAEYFPDITKETFIEMATINPANHLSLNCGAIEKGRDADIIGFRYDSSQNMLNSVFNADKADFAMINGQTLRLPDGIK